MRDPTAPADPDRPSRKRRIAKRVYLAARRHGPTAPVWRTRAAIFSGAVLLGLVALLFANAADRANHIFLMLYGTWR